MDIAQSLVRSAYQSLGYFVIEGIKIGVREIDLLAVKLDKNAEIMERLHIEVQISTHPIGVLRGKQSIKGSVDKPLELAEEYIQKKYHHKAIIKQIQKYFRAKEYRKVLVYGKLKDMGQLKVFQRHNIETVNISDLIKNALKADPVIELVRSIRVAEIITL